MKKNFLFFLFCSLMIHIFLFLIVSHSFSPNTNTIAVRIEEKTDKAFQIVDQNTFNHKKPKETPYFSQYNNMADQEYKGKTGLNPPPFAHRSLDSETDFSLKDSSPAFYGRIDHLGNIENESDYTRLNTRELWFYTFSSRVKRQIYWHWIRHLKIQISRIRSQNEQIWPYEQLLTTRISAFLDEKGRLQSLVIREKSGLAELDQAGVFAIQNAHPFPNPPKELMDQDGLIHLNYTFVLENTYSSLP